VNFSSFLRAQGYEPARAPAHIHHTHVLFSDLLPSQSKHNARGNTRPQLTSAASQIGIEQVELKNSDSEFLSQFHIYPAAARHECEIRIEAPYLRTEDVSVRVD
jgi:hypothetical protein